MAPVSKKKRPSKEVLAQWIDEVNTHGKRLTDWEKNFMESLTNQFEETNSLSEKQEEILERIYADKT